MWFSPWPTTRPSELLAVHVIHLFGHTAVPAFLFVAGYLLAHERQRPFGDFVRRKALRLVLPLVFWTAAAVLYFLWYDGPSAQFWHRLAYLDIAGQFYFIVVLVILVFAFYPLLRSSPGTLGWVALGAFVVNAATIVYYERTTVSGDFATLAYRNPLIWVFFFAFGLWCSTRPLEWFVRVLPFTLPLMAAAAAAFFIQGEVLDGYPASYFGLLQFLFSCAAVPVYVGLFMLLFRGRATASAMAPLVALGGYSYAIFLVHIPYFVGYVTNNAIPDGVMRWLLEDYFRLMNALFVVGITTSLAAVIVAGWLLPGPSRLLLGIERRQPRWRRLSLPGRAPSPQPAQGHAAADARVIESR